MKVSKFAHKFAADKLKVTVISEKIVGDTQDSFGEVIIAETTMTMPDYAESKAVSPKGREQLVVKNRDVGKALAKHIGIENCAVYLEAATMVYSEQEDPLKAKLKIFVVLGGKTEIEFRANLVISSEQDDFDVLDSIDKFFSSLLVEYVVTNKD